ncbi:MAG: hypothetical protein HYT21_02255 [Candidatus Nealsonbacteria bacterium]|nr:hypothetical protein [Candidatus Nealsonbacteria bacterium]
MKLDELKDKKILILGFGREGRDTLKFLKKLFPRKKIDIADQKFDKNYLEKTKDYDVIIKSPGIPFKSLRTTGVRKLTTQTEIFFDNCPGKIIGVTGTKGKSTTASMIYAILKAGNIRSELIGNIGKPVLSLLAKTAPEKIFIYELSSFQLTNLKTSPHIAVLLNIYPEHLDYYRSFKEYVQAKANIAKYQKKSDYLIYNSENAQIKTIVELSKAKKIPIKGQYYQLDIEAAKRVGEIFQIPPRKVELAIRNFKFLPHRLEYIGRFKGIKFYNDSLATVPEATIGALNHLGDDIQTLILGGFDRGLNFKKLAESIAKSKVKTLILFPTTGSRILRDLRNPSLKSFSVNTMKEAVKLAYRYTDRGKICLLSPASPSFGLFRDYADRGDQFRKFVRGMKNATIN